MNRILVIDDAQEFQVFLHSFLREYELTQASTVSEAMQILRPEKSRFDLILLDLSLPDGNGLQVLSVLRESVVYKDTPIIIVSGDSNVLTKITAFGLGADDYMIKPFDYGELKARISARLRIAKIQQKEKSQFSYGDLVIDSTRMTVSIRKSASESSTVTLTPTEYQILLLLTHRPEMVFSREVIIDCVWGAGKHVTTRTVDAHVCHLRSKLEESKVDIKTVLNYGYKAVFNDSI